ncbi:oligosaccharide repeat unit polymerase [Citrobacter sp. R56]|uniref:oligosaccharide repeat unit polymerase n=1 Tax=Citrobacter sp. R56 TaxID=1573676 RepID=UPI00193B3412|nr:oligosaccharide repeat unit polymerase [Citrobacter sp. R56]QRG77529.1 oligosaccharide repeat unit polymerase [Citrobacter sp. R56]
MNKTNKFYITLIIIEIVFGGGGRLLDPLGIPPLRYVLFAAALALFILNVLTMNSSLGRSTAITMIMLVGLPIYGAFVGTVNGNLTSDIAFDLQPFAYMLISLYVCTQSEIITSYSVECFIKTTKIFSIIASSLYIFYIVMLKAGMVNFPSFYSTLSLTSEFFFRPSGAFFAKSFFFIGIGAIFFFIEKRYFLFLLSISALFLTETRGVFLFAGISMMIASLRINGAVKNALYIGIAVAAGFALMVVVGDRAGDSDSVRINDFEFIIKEMNGLYSVFGHGFGSQILDRGRIEVVPLELLYKTGLIGIILSIFPLFLLSIRTLIKKFTTRQLQIVCALIFSAGVSITNPFLYTPMGIFVIAMAINSNKLAKG